MEALRIVQVKAASEAGCQRQCVVTHYRATLRTVVVCRKAKAVIACLHGAEEALGLLEAEAIAILALMRPTPHVDQVLCEDLQVLEEVIMNSPVPLGREGSSTVVQPLEQLGDGVL